MIWWIGLIAVALILGGAVLWSMTVDMENYENQLRRLQYRMNQLADQIDRRP